MSTAALDIQSLRSVTLEKLSPITVLSGPMATTNISMRECGSRKTESETQMPTLFHLGAIRLRAI